MVTWNRGQYSVNNIKMDATGNVVDASSVFSPGKSKFDMQLWVIDAGLSLGYNFDNGLRAYVAGGPTLSIADMESSCRGKHHPPPNLAALCILLSDHLQQQRALCKLPNYFGS